MDQSTFNHGKSGDTNPKGRSRSPLLELYTRSLRNEREEKIGHRTSAACGGRLRLCYTLDEGKESERETTNCPPKRVRSSPHIDETGIATNVIDAIWVGTGNCGTGEIVTLNLDGLFGRQPLLAGIVVIAQKFLLLGIDRHDRDALPQTLFHRGIDVPELRIAIGVIPTFLCLAIPLHAVLL